VVCSDPDDILASTEYGGDVAAIVQHDNVYGVQFHPEKSHRFGMALLDNFAGI
jgi:glutamine amidotransferase